MSKDNYQENIIYEEPFDWETFWWDRMNDIPALVGLVVVIGCVWYMIKYFIKKDK